jgi:hypothetical protein
MQHTITVSPANGSQEGWQVRCFYWGNGDHPSPPEYNLDWAEQNGVFTATADLHHGKNVISCDILAGVDVNINLDPPSPIYLPPGLQWPVKPSVPPSQTADFDTYYFAV